LNGSDPTQVLDRADEQILSPKLDWEMGNATRGDQTPYCVFIDGALRREDAVGNGNDNGDGGEGGDTDRFVAHYGATDTYIGAMAVTVHKPSPRR
jgi:predicted GH43/DUF377 family glycosyl hydrolase